MGLSRSLHKTCRHTSRGYFCTILAFVVRTQCNDVFCMHHTGKNP